MPADDPRPLGELVAFQPAPRPGREPLRGTHVLLRPVDPDRDAGPLYAASHPPAGDASIWTYLFDGPFEDTEQMKRDLSERAVSEDPLFFTIEPLPDGDPSGIASYLRITPEFGVIEIGNIWFAPRLQRTVAATEAIYLLARQVFDDLGYRRLEWKCDALNATSRRAAERFGFTFEGVFREHMVIKGRNRDTAWYAIVDGDWPALRAAFERWLDPANFDASGQQLRRLSELRQ